MRLAASQIGWAPGDEAEALGILRECGFAGLEIAPTLAVGPTPYARPQAAADFAQRVKREHGLQVCSLQSLWYGVQGSLFGPQRDFLLDYTRQAILFAQAAGAGNLVFGCPKQRNLPQGANPDGAVAFFRELGDFAAAHGAVLALEPNPPLYGTNFINTTPQAFAMVQQVNSPGFLVNLDFGTLIENGEDVALLQGKVAKISHVHISEPGLPAVVQRPEHRRLADILRAEDYRGWVSIEMKAQPPDVLRRVANYVAEVFA